MAFGGRTCPSDRVVRTFVVKVMSSPAQTARAFELLENAGDAWAWAIDRQNLAWRENRRANNDASALWEDQKAHGPFGTLSATSAQDVILSWQRAFFEAARRRRAGDHSARYPMAKRRYQPVAWRRGKFTLVASSRGPDRTRRRPRVRLEVARGHRELNLRLSHDHPYDPESVRAVRLVPQGEELFLAITAWVKIAPAQIDNAVVAGVDPGIIHPFAGSCGEAALLVSGRGLRAEERLHLEDTEARARRMSTKRPARRATPGKPRDAGSRRFRKLRAAQRKAETRNRALVAQAGFTAANHVTRFCVTNGVGTVAYGDPAGITERDFGVVHNRRLHRWPRAGYRDALARRLEERSILSSAVDERGTSSRCPKCGFPATKAGRWLICRNPACAKRHHRDLAASQNITLLGEGTIAELGSVEHRRVGRPARRDRRRQLWVATRRASSAPTSGNARTRAASTRGTIPAEESSVTKVARDSCAATSMSSDVSVVSARGY